MTKRLCYIDLGAGIMILWMIIYHALCYSWGFELQDYWEIADLSLLPKGLKAQINSEGKLEAINPCIVFPYLSFFMPCFFISQDILSRK